jgi:small subunit ribosomal protein S8e
LGAKRIHPVRVRGGHIKFRAIRLDTGNFSWGSEGNKLNFSIISKMMLAITRKSRILGVVYNASNNEFVRTNTLVKNSIVQIDATPFRQWYEQHYGVSLIKKKKGGKVRSIQNLLSSLYSSHMQQEEQSTEEKKKSKHVQAILKARQAERVLDPHIEEQFPVGRLYACISSRPGQSGRCDGYILEGKELDFYLRKLQRKKEKKEKGTA